MVEVIGALFRPYDTGYLKGNESGRLDFFGINPLSRPGS